MDEMPSEARAGRLLVASPVLGDPNFRRTVVLIVEHESQQGTLGVVLNRPTQVPVGQVLEPWTELATDPSVVFNGGPVAPSSGCQPTGSSVPGTSASASALFGATGPPLNTTDGSVASSVHGSST
jgi:putative AlgH/UPF0301 family transcriptional regulator